MYQTLDELEKNTQDVENKITNWKEIVKWFLICFQFIIVFILFRWIYIYGFAKILYPTNFLFEKWEWMTWNWFSFVRSPILRWLFECFVSFLALYTSIIGVNFSLKRRKGIIWHNKVKKILKILFIILFPFLVCSFWSLFTKLWFISNRFNFPQLKPIYCTNTTCFEFNSSSYTFWIALPPEWVVNDWTARGY